MKRPTSIIWFERLYLASTLLWLIQEALAWPNTRQIVADSPQAAQLGADTIVSLYVGSMAFIAILSVLLWYFAARQRANVAKWIIVGCFAIGLFFYLPGQLATLRNAPSLQSAIAVAVLLLTAGAIAMLFRRDAVAWFRNGR